MTTEPERQELLRIAELVLSGPFSAGTIYVLKDDMQTLARWTKAQLSQPIAAEARAETVVRDVYPILAQSQEPSSGERHA